MRRGFVGLVRIVMAGAVVAALPACSSSAGGASADPACSGARVPTLVSAEPDAELNDLFRSYADGGTREDYSGGDGLRSIALPDGRSLWTYGDSFLGPVNPDKSRPKDAAVVPNLLVVQDGDQLSTIYTHGNPPGPAIPVPGENPKQRWFWLGAGTVANGVVEIILHQIHRTEGRGNFGFADLIGTEGGERFRFTDEKEVLARLSLPDLRLIGLTDLDTPVPKLSWGAEIIRDGGYTYVYGVGVEDHWRAKSKSMHVARVEGDSLTGTWQYFTGNGWSATEADSKTVLDGVGAAYGVSKVGRFYTAIMVVPFDPEVYAYFSCSPTGPFTNKTAVYRTPKSSEDKVYTYNLDVHDQLVGGGRLVVSYNVSKTVSVFEWSTGATRHRPVYLDLTFSTP